MAFVDVLLRFSAANDYQYNPAYQAYSAEHGREWDALLLFRGGLNRAEIQYLLTLGVGDPAVHQRENANNNQNDADNSGWLHRAELTMRAGLKATG